MCVWILYLQIAPNFHMILEILAIHTSLASTIIIYVKSFDFILLYMLFRMAATDGNVCKSFWIWLYVLHYFSVFFTPFSHRFVRIQTNKKTICIKRKPWKVREPIFHFFLLVHFTYITYKIHTFFLLLLLLMLMESDGNDFFL